MISNSKQDPGFTLIEIMVVMFIAVLGLSLVGPRLFGAYEKIGRSAEEQKLADIVEGVSLRSFFRQTGYTLTLEGSTLDLKGLETIVRFEYITFPPQAIIFNGNGYSDTQGIRYNAGEREKYLPLEWNGSRHGPG